MEKDLTLRISIEELALACILNGKAEEGNALIAGSLGRDVSQDELIGRLTSASHTLLGKGLLDLSADGNVVGSPILTEVVDMMTSARCTLRYSLSSPEERRVLSYHFVGDSIYEHWIDTGVVHVITRVDAAEPVTTCPLFFSLETFRPTPEAAGVIAESLFRQALRQKQVAEAENLLCPALPATICRPLSEDAVHTKAIGDVMLIHYQANREPVSDEGQLILFGAERFWVFHPTKDGDMVKVSLVPGTIDNLQQYVRQLVDRQVQGVSL
ncbi:hypothetical protein [Chloroflexus sp.]|uniref:hypothetical protein n=1 Tax=Chloroflexus sp. TaxID=1904827 RepID=UPI002603724D|nr:hypothetical protein [uncultured Chloroflexus sp.]